MAKSKAIRPTLAVQVVPGMVFHRLTVISSIKTDGACLRWLCRCACGTEKVVQDVALRRGIKSCGCFTREAVSIANRTHGMRNLPEYSSWSAMRARCINPQRKSYARYGGRGITICDRWLNSFPNFYADMGPKPSSEYSLERINNSGPYSPENCRWATGTEQCSNTRRNRILEHDGLKMTATQWAAFLDINYFTLIDRLVRGWSVERTLTEPVLRR